jgi:hypothetical protein
MSAVLREEKLDEIRAQFKQSSRQCLAQEKRVSKWIAKPAEKSLNLQPYKTTAVHSLEPL